MITEKTEQLVKDLREQMATVRTVDPSGPTYRKLCDFLDSLDTDVLRLIRDADVKFMSALARNRVIRREANA